ncbi:MAG: M1 family aminopeptidase, partial [Acidobacteriota bacterium]
MPRTVTAWALAAIALVGAHVPASADPTAEAVVEALRSPALQDDAGHRAADLELRVGPATLTLEDGVLYPSLSIEGRPVQFVFTGTGRLESPAPDEIEAGQLRLFTGMDHLDLPFEGAVLVAAGDAVSAAISRNGSPPGEADATDAPAAVARELLERWVDSTEAKLAAVEGPLFLDAMGDSLLDGYFAAWLTGTPHGDVLFTVDPRLEEALTVSHFVAEEIEGRELRSIRRALGRAHRRGRMRDLEVEDLGNQDVWMSHAVAPPEGTTWPAREAFEPSHYALEIDLARSDPWLRGSAAIDLTGVAGGRRGLSLDLMSDLIVTAVHTGDGTPLPFHQQRGDLSVALPGESREGEDLRLVVEYEGNPVDQVQHRTFALLSTRMWYPHAGEIDRATYDVTFHVPSGLDLLAPGHREEESREDGGGQRIRYVLDYPARQFSFELGDFVVKEQTVGKVRVRVAYDRESSGFPGKVKKEIETTVRDALLTFQEMFGEYPLDRLTVVLTPRGFSQGFLGFVTLSHYQMSTHGGWRDLFWWLPDREAFIAHEIAHQWWGNLVGWASYRDQWLSEGLANWSAEAYMRRQTEGGADPEKGPFLGWTDALLDVNEEGILVESLGPVVLGSRLDSSAYPGGYIPIVYLKGGMIIDMLSRYAGEETFEQMLGQLAAAAQGHDLTTAEFVKAMERMLGRNLSWFDRRWVRGTGLPTVDYTYSFRQEPQGGWTVEFEAIQRAMHYSRSHLVRTHQSGWDLERYIVVPALPVEKSILAVEFQVLTEGEGEGRKRGSRLERFGNAVLRGSSSSFHITVPTQPVRAWLDRREMAPARFFCETCEPKRTSLFRGADLAIAGEWED